MNKKKRGAFCTDIHFGRKGNSLEHNQDCINFLEWFIKKVKDYECDYVGFLGDWHENRSALNILSLNYSLQGAKLLDSLDLPVFHVIGNHDLYYRHSRELHSVPHFNSLKNFIIIEKPHLEKSILGDVLFSPYLFHAEYDDMDKYTSCPFWAGHFEFKGFKLTGYDMIMKEGPDHTVFQEPTHIISGHFHKRQSKDNVTYIGNRFPMDFGDAGDYDRGMAVYDHEQEKMFFENWIECPKYQKIKLSQLLDGDTLYEQARVKCAIDIPNVTYEQRLHYIKHFSEQYNLREFEMIESQELVQALENTEIDDVSAELLEQLQQQGSSTTDEIVVGLLKNIQTDKIDSSLLVDTYTKLKV